MNSEVRIFISYAREDQERAREIHRRLTERGYKPWLDEEDLLPGQDFRLVIEKSLTSSDFVIICLSKNSVAKRSFFQREIKYALDKLQEMRPEDIFVIPARLDDCEMPEELKDRHWVNPFEERGWERLFRALESELRKRGRTPPRPPILDAPVKIEEPDRQTARESEILKPKEPAPKPADVIGLLTMRPDLKPELQDLKVGSKSQPAKAQPTWPATVAGLIPAKRRAGAIAAATVMIALLGYGAWTALRDGNGIGPATGPTAGTPPASTGETTQFETVKFDERGNELNRETKQAKGLVEELGNNVKTETIPTALRRRAITVARPYR